MIRPEAAQVLRRWREAAIGCAVIALGAWLALTSFGLVRVTGLVVIAGGVALTVSGLRRARLWTGSEAPGIVEVVEGRITYLGPVMGGTAALDDLQQIVFRRSPGGEAFWRLIPADGRDLYIPEGAQGADVLLDALTPLPDFDGGAMVRAVQARAPGTHVVWQRTATNALT